MEIAELAVRWRDHGVVGFDIAGPESGYRPTRHLDAFEHVRRENFHITIHAGESFGLPSIWEAIQLCGAERLGHGVRIVDDITVREDGVIALGRLAAFVRDRRVPLEMCSTSNVHRGHDVDRDTPDRSPAAAAVPGHRQHRQSADERGLALVGVRGPGRCVRAGPG
jgi:adenosine deaminase